MRRLSFLALLASLLAASALQAQQGGLGAAAAREKQRREEAQKKGGAGKAYTNDDLSKVEATTATPATPQRSQDAGRRERRGDGSSLRERAPGGGVRSSESDEEASGPQGKGQDAWRTEAQQKREAVKSAEQKVEVLQRRNESLLAEILGSTDTNQILRLRAQQQSLNEELEAAQRELSGVRQELAQFEESARRAGVPPGWLRER